MIVRIDTTNITRGREFTLYAKNPNSLAVTVMAVEIETGDVSTLSTTHKSLGEFDAYESIAPQINGYLLAIIGTQKVVKKIGNPNPAFTIGYKQNYTVPYTALDGAGVELATGNLTALPSGFYYTKIPTDTAVVKCLKKNFIVNKDLLKMNYEITMEGGVLNSTYDTPILENVVLQEVTLPNAELGTASLDSTLPDVTITEL